MIFEFTVKKSADEVFEYLSDMQKFVAVHPIIYRIDAIADEQYLVFERLKLLAIPWKFKYIIKLEKRKTTREIFITTTIKKVVQVNIHFLIREISDKSHITETVSFKSLLPVVSIMNKIFSDQHKLLFENIEKA